jgi:hypothetical protein
VVVCNLIVFGLVLSTGWLGFGGESLFIYAVATVGTAIAMVWAFVTNRDWGMTNAERSATLPDVLPPSRFSTAHR